jgi:hypothetical protein
MTVQEIYDGSDGDATKALYVQLAALGPIGAIAINLLRAQKASSRAKVYRGGIRGQGSYKSMAYERKEWALSVLCTILEQCAPDVGLVYGWQHDEGTPGYPWVLYVELPTGQASFHAPRRGVGPTYGGVWDGVRDVSADRIVRWVQAVLDTPTSRPQVRSGAEAGRDQNDRADQVSAIERPGQPEHREPAGEQSDDGNHSNRSPSQSSSDGTGTLPPAIESPERWCDGCKCWWTARARCPVCRTALHEKVRPTPLPELRQWRARGVDRTGGDGMSAPTSRPRVPASPEGLTALRARYHAAVADVINQIDVVGGKVDSPSGDPKHVFDTPEGWRLIVSLERMPDGRVGVHLSASVHDTYAAKRALTLRRELTPTGMLDAIVRAWRFIANSERTPLYLGLSEGGIPHWFIERGH